MKQISTSDISNKPKVKLFGTTEQKGCFFENMHTRSNKRVRGRSLTCTQSSQTLLPIFFIPYFSINSFSRCVPLRRAICTGLQAR